MVTQRPVWDLEICTLGMQGGVTKSVLERAALSEGKEIGSNAFTAEVSKKLKSISCPKILRIGFKEKKTSRSFVA